MSDDTRLLSISWSISRGRETDGYNICRLDDSDTGKRFRCMGGGYDMTGTVFGEWLQETYQERLAGIRQLAAARYSDGKRIRNDAPEALYGMVDHVGGRVSVDGACGISSMERIAKEIGLSVRHIVNRRGNLTALLVTDNRDDA